MTDQKSGNTCAFDLLVDELVKKLHAHRTAIEKSQSYGRIIWRFNPKNGIFEIQLELKL